MKRARLSEYPRSRPVGEVGDNPGDIAGCHGGIGALFALGNGALDCGLSGEGVLCAELPRPSAALVSIVKFRGGALLSAVADVASAFGSSVMLRMSRSLTPLVLLLHAEWLQPEEFSSTGGSSEGRAGALSVVGEGGFAL